MPTMSDDDDVIILPDPEVITLSSDEEVITLSSDEEVITVSSDDEEAVENPDREVAVPIQNPEGLQEVPSAANRIEEAIAVENPVRELAIPIQDPEDAQIPIQNPEGLAARILRPVHLNIKEEPQEPVLVEEEEEEVQEDDRNQNPAHLNIKQERRVLVEEEEEEVQKEGWNQNPAPLKIKKEAKDLGPANNAIEEDQNEGEPMEEDAAQDPQDVKDEEDKEEADDGEGNSKGFVWPLPDPTMGTQKRSMLEILNLSDSDESTESEVDPDDPDRQLGLEKDPDRVRRRFDREAGDWPVEARFQALGINDPGADWVPKEPLRDEPAMSFTDYKLLALKDDRMYQYINREWEPEYLKEEKDKVVRFKMDFSGLEEYNPPWYRWITSDKMAAMKAAREKEEKARRKEEEKERRRARAPKAKKEKLEEQVAVQTRRELREERARRRRVWRGLDSESDSESDVFSPSGGRRDADQGRQYDSGQPGPSTSY